MDFSKLFEGKKISPYIIPGLDMKSLRPPVKKDPPPEWREPKEIMKLICTWTGFTLAQIKVKSRKKRVLFARKYLTWYLFKRSEYNKSDIARILEQNHATIINTLNDVQDLIDTDEEVKKYVDWLGEEISKLGQIKRPIYVAVKNKKSKINF